MTLQRLDLETMLAEIGRAGPIISGSTAALVAAQLGTAMVRMALVVSHRHGSDTDMLVERLDSILSEIKKAAEKDRVASSALIGAYHESSDQDARRLALIRATREPLAAAHCLTELLELLTEACEGINEIVASDFYGGVELISGAFRAVFMAVESNLDHDAEQLRTRTSYNRSSLVARFDVAIEFLRRKGSLSRGP
ncbi:cyclodeaminase/cyclohydrolase family protein [Neorhizobium sp. LjRoot104]|uniref:cyclodeaminase/cyclohydrolase family protein n=1 Tax=Neorhizobium sp. LjRoot104 TaxID=3342254 RepID=UPI003ECF3CDF